MTAVPVPDADRHAVQRRTVGVLSGSVALAGLGVAVGVTAGGLLARDVAGTDSASGLGQTAGVLVVGGFGLVAGVSAALVVPLALVWLDDVRAVAQRPR